MHNTLDFDKDITFEDALEFVHTLKRKSHENLDEIGSARKYQDDEEDDTEVDMGKN